MLTKRMGWVLPPRLEVLGEAQLGPQRRAGSYPLRLRPLFRPDRLRGREDPARLRKRREHHTVVVRRDEPRIVDAEPAEGGGSEGIGRPGAQRRTRWAAAVAEDREIDRQKLGGVAVC